MIIAYMDRKCPRCGQVCGNSGYGFIFRCPCGWEGRLDPEDEAMIIDFWKRAKARDEGRGDAR